MWARINRWLDGIRAYAHQEVIVIPCVPFDGDWSQHCIRALAIERNKMKDEGWWCHRDIDYSLSRGGWYIIMRKGDE